mmetsp:Transcript_6496/g.19271  ORF Transcript_6496/g.19271 Transcript_6496/m.19271 type:complete len:329 (+) Transcript_6496:1107-2093(+)
MLRVALDAHRQRPGDALRHQIPLQLGHLLRLRAGDDLQARHRRGQRAKEHRGENEADEQDRDREAALRERVARLRDLADEHCQRPIQRRDVPVAKGPVDEVIGLPHPTRLYVDCADRVPETRQEVRDEKEPHHDFANVRRQHQLFGMAVVVQQVADQVRLGDPHEPHRADHAEAPEAEAYFGILQVLVVDEYHLQPVRRHDEGVQRKPRDDVALCDLAPVHDERPLLVDEPRAEGNQDVDKPIEAAEPSHGRLRGKRPRRVVVEKRERNADTIPCYLRKPEAVPNDVRQTAWLDEPVSPQLWLIQEFLVVVEGPRLGLARDQRRGACD